MLISYVYVTLNGKNKERKIIVWIIKKKEKKIFWWKYFSWNCWKIISTTLIWFHNATWLHEWSVKGHEI